MSKGWHETYQFLNVRFDVRKALGMITRGEILQEGPMALEGAVQMLGIHHINEEHADKITELRLEVPVILVEFDPDGDGAAMMLIDGWHRVWKAHKLGRETLPAVLINGEEVRL